MDAKTNAFVPAVRLSTSTRGRDSILVVGLKIETDPSDHPVHLLVGFDHWEWDVDVDGLLCGDQRFHEDVRVLLSFNGYDARELSYSDSSLQGLNYVRFDVGPSFVKSWIAIAASRAALGVPP